MFKKKCAKCVAACDSVTFASARFSLGSSGGKSRISQGKGQRAPFHAVKGHIFIVLCVQTVNERGVLGGLLESDSGGAPEIIYSHP